MTRLSLSERQIGKPSTATTVDLHGWLQRRHAQLMDDLSGIEVTPQFDRALSIAAWSFAVVAAVLIVVGAATVGRWLAGWSS